MSGFALRHIGFQITCSNGHTEILEKYHFLFTIFTALKRSCGKVMFLHLSVSYSVHGGGGLPERDTPDRAPLDRDLPERGPLWTEIPLGRDLPWTKTFPDRDPPVWLRAVGTHLAGMHSCSLNFCHPYGWTSWCKFLGYSLQYS